MAAETAASPTFAELQRPLPARSARAWRFAAARAASHAGALLSDGLRIGYAHGFDSGPFMAHVYANRPSGRTVVGRAIDRRLLRRRTCVAFRDIRALAEHAVFDALRAEPGPQPVVADLAAGPAPYLLSALTVTFRDFRFLIPVMVPVRVGLGFPYVLVWLSALTVSGAFVTVRLLGTNGPKL